MSEGLVSLIEVYVKLLHSENVDARVAETLVECITFYYPHGKEELEKVCKERYGFFE